MTQIPHLSRFANIIDVEFEELEPTADLEYPEAVMTAPILGIKLDEFLTNRYYFRHG